MVARKRAHSALRNKLWRDMGHAAMQFAAIVLLCALGTWVYSGLDGAWRMIDLSAETYFTQYNLADFWVNVSSPSKADLDNLRNIHGVEGVQARFSDEMDTPALGDGVTLLVHAVQGESAINVPLVRQGAALAPSDLRGCLLQEQFAQAHGLNVGDTLKLSVEGTDMNFIVRGLILSPEHVITSKDETPDPVHYGFALISKDAVTALPINEVLVSLSPGADATAVENAIQSLLPQALILTRQTHASTQRTHADVTLFKNLTYVFPVLAFGVAAMIVLTTLTRMIENQRMQMGTLKALGYNNRQIRRHYLCYAFVPSLVGALLGLIVGRYTLPDILYGMEAAHYILPVRLRAPISLSAWGITGLMVLLSVLICLYAYHKQAQEQTAALLRPKPPKAGSRVMLENWKGLWRSFSFNNKMILRNIARNKGRAMVAMVGLLCCNMLIICAMGLQDSIQASISEYYTGTIAYDLRADLDTTAGTLESYQARLAAGRVEGIMEKRVSLRYAGQSRTVVMNVLKENQRLLRLGKGFSVEAPPENGIAVSRKLADVMGLYVGDTVEIWLAGDDEGLPFAIEAVYETNIGQSVYIASGIWEALHKGAFQPTALLLQAPTALTLTKMDTMDEITAFKRPAEQFKQTLTIMDSTTAVFNLMYGAAIGLAFVICYNMGLINFTERTRDYATLKVLGYHQKEIRRLMMRENNLITLLGAGLGVVPGIWLTQAVLIALHSENNVFVEHVSLNTMLLATVITCLFSILIERLLTRKVRSIDMVEALKSVE
ncbi:MAG: FtsX-like permease family protein [Eubacteriales bacterium]|nr:FtsX-like permease family protein [Eubacteriales bacterium]